MTALDPARSLADLSGSPPGLFTGGSLNWDEDTPNTRVASLGNRSKALERSSEMTERSLDVSLGWIWLPSRESPAVSL